MQRVSCLAALAAFLLGSASIAQAEEIRLDDQQLDQVTAGNFSGIDDFLGGFPGEGIEFPDDVFDVIGGIQFPDDVFGFLEELGIVNGIFDPE